jgi:transposase-like protein
MGTKILCINRQRFVVGKQKIKKIFLDETYLKINGQDYWLWLAYDDEPNLYACICYFTSQEKEQFSMLLVL